MINKETGEVFDIIVEQDGKYVIAKQACAMIEGYERQMKEIKDQYAEYKQALLEAMEEHGIDKIDTAGFVANYIKPTERITLDSKKVEAEYPDVYRECMKVSDVKASVRVRLR